MAQRPVQRLPQKLQKLQSLLRLRVQTSALSRPLEALKHPVLLVSLLATGLVLGARQTGGLEPFNLGVYDWMVRSRPAPAPDPRLLVVTVTEEDIQQQKQWPLRDEVLANVLKKLVAMQPRAVGLDIYRDLPVDPGHQSFQAILKQHPNIIPVCKVSDAESPGVAAPPNVPTSQVGFSDLVVDPGGILRRALIFIEPSAKAPCQARMSFSFQLVHQYLKAEKIEPKLTAQGELQIGPTLFKRLDPMMGGYQGVDARGYQILLNYHSASRVSRQVTLGQVLRGEVDPAWVKDKIVMIGVTAPSIDDAFYTPYSSRKQKNQKMPGVVVHAQIVNQMLSAVLDGRPLFWSFADWGEWLWIGGWALVGGLVAWQLRHPLWLSVGTGTVFVLLVGSSWILFLQAGWVPVVGSVIALSLTTVGIITYRAHQDWQTSQKIIEQVQEQERLLALLKPMVSEVSSTVAWTGATPDSQQFTTAIPATTPLEEDEESTAAWNPSLESLMQQGETSSVNTSAATLEDRVNRSGRQSRDLDQYSLGGRYSTVRGLAAGGFGHTYLAEDTKLPGRPLCVVKHLMPARTDEKFLGLARRLFRTEAEILQRLGHHQQIPRLLAYFEENQQFYLVEEYIAGHPLNEELPVDKRLPERQVWEMLVGILEVLAFIHEHRVIHRDIKPSNIIRREKDDRLVLIDFGAVKEIQPSLENAPENHTVAIGTRGYTPPEQYAGHPTLSSDIYAVGMIGIEALTGIRPHQLPTDANSGEIQWRHLVSIREDFAYILEKMVKYHFSDRHGSASLALQDLKDMSW